MLYLPLCMKRTQKLSFPDMHFFKLCDSGGEGDIISEVLKKDQNHS